MLINHKLLKRLYKIKSQIRQTNKTGKKMKKKNFKTKSKIFNLVFFVWIHFNEIHTCSSNHLYGSDAFPERGHCGDRKNNKMR